MRQGWPTTEIRRPGGWPPTPERRGGRWTWKACATCRARSLRFPRPANISAALKCLKMDATGRSHGMGPALCSGEQAQTVVFGVGVRGRFVRVVFTALPNGVPAGLLDVQIFGGVSNGDSGREEDRR